MLHSFYWACWIGGTILIVLSNKGVVSPQIGWAGFWVACGAAVLSRVPWPVRRRTAEADGSWAELTREILERKDERYTIALTCLHGGGSVVYDDISIAVHSRDDLSIAATTLVAVGELDDARVQADAGNAKSKFEEVASLAPEIAAIAAGKRLVVTLYSELSEDGIEICQVIDDHVDWSIHRETESRNGNS